MSASGQKQPFCQIRAESALTPIRPVRVYRVRLGGTAPKAAPTLPLPDKPSIAVLPFQNVAVCIAAASGALAGKRAEAEKAMVRLRQINPALCISNLEHLLPIRRPEDLARLAEGLRKAGLPE